jgi:branched-chain amino acid transport system permease protein
MMFTLYGFIIAVMGGLGSIYGAFLVALLLGLVFSGTSFLIGGVFEHIATMTVLIIVLLTKPMGVIPTRRDV